MEWIGNPNWATVIGPRLQQVTPTSHQVWAGGEKKVTSEPRELPWSQTCKMSTWLLIMNTSLWTSPMTQINRSQLIRFGSLSSPPHGSTDHSCPWNHQNIITKRQSTMITPINMNKSSWPENCDHEQYYDQKSIMINIIDDHLINCMTTYVAHSMTNDPIHTTTWNRWSHQFRIQRTMILVFVFF